MWPGEQNKSRTVVSSGNSSEVRELRGSGSAGAVGTRENGPKRHVNTLFLHGFSTRLHRVGLAKVFTRIGLGFV